MVRQNETTLLSEYTQTFATGEKKYVAWCPTPCETSPTSDAHVVDIFVLVSPLEPLDSQAKKSMTKSTVFV